MESLRGSLSLRLAPGAFSKSVSVLHIRTFLREILTSPVCSLASYGVAVRLRQNRGSWNFWAFQAWCSHARYDRQLRRRALGGEQSKFRWTEDDLIGRRKGDPEKVKIALRLCRESTMSLKWIAQRLKMGAWTHVSNLLGQERKKGR